MSGNLKKGSDGGLLHGPGGHLVHGCGDGGCCIDCPQGACVPTQWTITFSGVTVDTSCIAAANLAVGTSGFLDGTYTVTAAPTNPLVFWITTTSNALWADDEGDACVTTPYQQYRILLEDESGSLTLQVDGGTAAQDLQLFYANMPSSTDFPCSAMTFENSITACGSDGVSYFHGCGGMAVVTAC